MEGSKIQTGELLAEAFDNSDQKFRDERSIFRGRGAVFERNIFRHMAKAMTIQKAQTGGRFVQAALKVMVACTVESYRDEPEPVEEKPAPEPKKPVEQKPKVKLPKLSRGASMPMKKMKLEMLGGSVIVKEKQAAKKVGKRRNSGSSAEDHAPNMLHELRKIYDTRHIQDEQHLLFHVDHVDESLYTDAALLQRESIRLIPEVHVILGELFQAVDVDDTGLIDKDEYIQLIHTLYYCLKAFWDETMPEISQKEHLQIALDDWETDCQGHEAINFDRFVIAIFKLADVWTDYLSHDTYLEFLKKLRQTLTVPTLLGASVGIGKVNTRRTLRSKQEVLDLKEGRLESISQLKKFATILEMYDIKTARWTMNGSLAFWLTKGSATKTVLNKNPEITSKMVLRYLAENAKDFEPSWVKTATHCKESLRKADVQNKTKGCFNPRYDDVNEKKPVHDHEHVRQQASSTLKNIRKQIHSTGDPATALNKAKAKAAPPKNPHWEQIRQKWMSNSPALNKGNNLAKLTTAVDEKVNSVKQYRKMFKQHRKRRTSVAEAVNPALIRKQERKRAREEDIKRFLAEKEEREMTEDIHAQWRAEWEEERYRRIVACQKEIEAVLAPALEALYEEAWRCVCEALDAAAEAVLGRGAYDPLKTSAQILSDGRQALSEVVDSELVGAHFHVVAIDQDLSHARYLYPGVSPTGKALTNFEMLEREDSSLLPDLPLAEDAPPRPPVRIERPLFQANPFARYGTKNRLFPGLPVPTPPPAAAPDAASVTASMGALERKRSLPRSPITASGARKFSFKEASTLPGVVELLERRPETAITRRTEFRNSQRHPYQPMPRLLLQTLRPGHPKVRSGRRRRKSMLLFEPPVPITPQNRCIRRLPQWFENAQCRSSMYGRPPQRPSTMSDIDTGTRDLRKISPFAPGVMPFALMHV